MVTTAASNQQTMRVSVWVKLFVLFHILAISFYALPRPPKAISEQRVQPGGTEWLLYWNDIYIKDFPPFRIYLQTTGFWQYWDMFAPNPSHTDQWGDAIVVYKDGCSKRYVYPRMYDLPITQKFLKERYRKFFERAGADEFAYLFPVVGLRIALLNDNLKNPPVLVKMFRHYREVAEPGKPQPVEYKSLNYFNYVVDQAELARVRKL